MKAAVLTKYRSPLEIVDRPEVNPGPGQVRVKVSACGVCGSDVLLREGGFNAGLPIVPGHEASGIVDATGPGVDDVAVGTPVAVYYIKHCSNCIMCMAGRVNMCLHLERMGVEFDGAFAETVIVPSRNVIAVEFSDDPVDIAVLTDAVATPYHALTSVVEARRGDTVVVWGVGGIGSNAVQIASLLGCHTIAVSRSKSKLDLAKRLGADIVIQASGDYMERLRTVTGSAGPDIIVQTVGSGPVDQVALEAAGIGTRVILIGASTEPFQIRSVDLIWREASLHGSRGFTPADIRAVLSLYRSGHLSTEHLTATRRPLEQINDALDAVGTSETLRTVIEFSASWK